MKTSEQKASSHLHIWFPGAEEEEQKSLLLPPRAWTTSQRSPWKTAAFWMTRNFSSVLADCRSCSMFRRAVAWYFSSIFLEQHVEPFGIHTCRSDPGERHKKDRKFALGGGTAGNGEETNSIRWYHCNYCLGKLMTSLEFVLSKQLRKTTQDCWAIAPKSLLCTHASTLLALAPTHSIHWCAGAE